MQLMSRGTVIFLLAAGAGIVAITWLITSFLMCGASSAKARASDEEPTRRSAQHASMESRATTRIRPAPFVESAAATQPSASESSAKLHVVIAADGAPASGAVVEVMSLESDSDDPIAIARLRGLRACSFGTPRPIVLVADVNGDVEVPPFRALAAARGRLGDLRGRAAVVEGKPATLRLSPELAVSVVAADGKPQAGIPVTLITSDSFFPFERGLTLSDGIARLSAEVTTVDLGEDSRPRSATASVVLALPLGPSIGASFDPEEIPRKPITLVLPKACRVRVLLVRSDGTTFTGAAAVGLKSGAPLDGLGPMEGRSSEVAATAGMAYFPHVGLTGSLNVLVVPSDPSLQSSSAVIDGPRGEGDEVVAKVVCGAPAFIARGRLVTPDGEAIGRMELSAKLSTEPEDDDPNRTWSRTGVDGRFMIRFDADPPTPRTKLILNIVEPREDVVEDADRPSEVVVPLPSPIPPSVDVGDVTVKRLPIVVAGRVVDSDGRGIPQAFVRPRRAEPGPQGDSYWISNLGARTGVDGAFEIRGNTSETRLAVVAWSPGWACEAPIRFEAGARQIEIVMLKAGGIAGSIVGLEGVNGTALPFSDPVAVTVSGSEVERWARKLGEWDPTGFAIRVTNGKFERRDIPPGNCAVHFLFAGVPEPLVTVPDVLVVAEGVNRDPRLQNVDVGRFMKSTIVTVVGVDRKPIAGARVGARPEGDASVAFTTMESGQDGRVIFKMPTSALEIVGAKKGYRHAVVHGSVENTVLTLTKATPCPVAIRLAEGVSLPDPPFHFRVELRMTAGRLQLSSEEAEWTDPRNEGITETELLEPTVTMMVDEPGDYLVVLKLWDERPRGSGSEFLKQAGGHATVTVKEGDTASVTITPDPDDLRQSVVRRKRTE